jgi:hypothetical protein
VLAGRTTEQVLAAVGRSLNVVLVQPEESTAGAGTSPAAQANALLSELGSLRHGPWWPSLDEVFRTARGFYPGTLAESFSAGQATLLS